MSEVTVSKVYKSGNSHVLALPKALWDALAWRDGNPIAIRQAGSKLIIERIPVEGLAILRGAPEGGAR